MLPEDSGADITRQAFEKVKKAVFQRESQAELDEKGRFLYHPADRSNFRMLRPESEMAEICRQFKRDLVIVCPERTNPENWDLVYAKNSVDRPAIRARYSAGEQEKYRPAVLGCLPTSQTELIWYRVKLYTSTSEKSWDKFWKMCVFLFCCLYTMFADVS
jgi:hypothetical protein